MIRENRTRDAERLIAEIEAEGISHPQLDQLIRDFREGKRMVTVPDGKVFFRSFGREFDTVRDEMQHVKRTRGRPKSLRAYPTYALEIAEAWDELRKSGVTWDKAIDELTARSAEFGNLDREAIRKRIKLIRRGEKLIGQ